VAKKAKLEATKKDNINAYKRHVQSNDFQFENHKIHTSKTIQDSKLGFENLKAKEVDKQVMNSQRLDLNAKEIENEI